MMLKKIIVQTAFFIGVFLLITWYQERDLLSTNGKEQMPNVVVKNMSLNPVKLSNVNGQPTLFYFWAPWCSICKLSMPNLQSFHESQLQQPESERVNVVSIALSYDSYQEVTNYVEEREYQFTTLLGNSKTSELFKIQGFPTYYLVDENGYLVSKSMGYSTELGMLLRSLML